MSDTLTVGRAGSSVQAQNGHYPAESRYLRYLPGLYHQDPFLSRFLLIFESVLEPIERLVGNLPLYTEPAFAPREFLPWLAHWVAVSLDSTWPIERQRALLARAVEIYRWRGTRRGLALHIGAYTGVRPLIQEERDGFVLGGDSGLGWTTRLLRTTPAPMHFVVTVPAPHPEALSEEVLRAIIEEDKPAHTTYDLRVVRCSPGAASLSDGHAALKDGIPSMALSQQ
ncbi:MAG TPA: phage tail protein [Chloroflexota bacterium]|jgi:phage tail-like protein|nr:phage tail protein [Chloroflexota bacterium]